MRILLTGGGTGGHVYPALAVLDSLRRHAFDMNGTCPEVLWIGTNRKEAEILPKYEIHLERVDIYPFKRSINAKSIKGNIKLAISLLIRKAEKQAFNIIRDFKPDFVISTGGYVAYPACQAALRMNIPLFQIEPNATPGLVTRRIAHKATLTYCSTEECAIALGNANKEVVGIPVRSYTGDLSRKEILDKYNMENGRKTVLITGGSLGSEFINELAFGTLLEIIDSDDSLKMNTQVIHQVGADNIEIACALAKSLEFPYSPFVYFDEMPEVLSIADLLISRSGASAVAEAVHFGIPAIFFPFIHHADRQQVKNAAPLVESRVCDMHLENDFDKEVFLSDFFELLNACTNPELCARIREFDRNAADSIAESILKRSNPINFNSVTERDV